MNGVSSRPPPVSDVPQTIMEGNPFATAYGYYMKYFIAIFGYSWIYLNAASVLSRGNAEGINVSGISIYMAVSASYLIWGFLRADSVIVLGSIISLIGNLLLLTAVFIVTST